MPGSFCTVCRVRIPKGSRCSRHRVVSPSSRAWHSKGASRLRKAMLSQSNGCVICGSREDLQLHHLVPARNGGATSASNLLVVCARCHREIESGRLQFEAEKRPPAA